MTTSRLEAFSDGVIAEPRTIKQVLLLTSFNPPALISSLIPLNARRMRWSKESLPKSVTVEPRREYPADALSPDNGPGSFGRKENYFLYGVGCGPFSSVLRSQIQPSRL